MLVAFPDGRPEGSGEPSPLRVSWSYADGSTIVRETVFVRQDAAWLHVFTAEKREMSAGALAGTSSTTTP